MKRSTVPKINRAYLFPAKPFQRPHKPFFVTCFARSDHDWGIPSKQDAIRRIVKANRIFTVTRRADNLKLSAAADELLSVLQQNIGCERDRTGIHDRLEFFAHEFQDARMVGVAVGQDHLFDRPLANADRYAGDSIDHAWVVPNIDQRIDALVRIPVSTDEIDVTAIDHARPVGQI